ncbi:unnamed protein product [Moneuplotes crassus]|uniref:Uncharacterized protein n=1 Tax=Euplotes crassus TaxID=5936 RepID=A0AAD2DB61_EUPCR|nr:unnamed protein product [Moneuplotes crassus]
MEPTFSHQSQSVSRRVNQDLPALRVKRKSIYHKSTQNGNVKKRVRVSQFVKDALQKARVDLKNDAENMLMNKRSGYNHGFYHENNNFWDHISNYVIGKKENGLFHDIVKSRKGEKEIKNLLKTTNLKNHENSNIIRALVLQKLVSPNMKKKLFKSGNDRRLTAEAINSLIHRKSKIHNITKSVKKNGILKDKFIENSMKKVQPMFIGRRNTALMKAPASRIYSQDHCNSHHFSVKSNETFQRDGSNSSMRDSMGKEHPKRFLSPAVVRNNGKSFFSTPGAAVKPKRTNFSPFSDSKANQSTLLSDELPNFRNASIKEGAKHNFSVNTPKKSQGGNKGPSRLKERIRAGTSKFKAKNANNKKKKQSRKQLTDDVGFLTNLASISNYQDISKKNEDHTSSDSDDYLDEKLVRRVNIAYSFNKISADLLDRVSPNAAKVNSQNVSKRAIPAPSSILPELKELDGYNTSESSSSISNTSGISPENHKNDPPPLKKVKLPKTTKPCSFFLHSKGKQGFQKRKIKI